MNALPYPTLSDAFRASVSRFPEQDCLDVLPETAQAYGIAAGAWTYARMAIEVDRLVALYRQAGYGHGHRIGLLLLNRPEFLCHFLALNTLGISAVPINAEFRAAEHEYLIGHSEIVAAVTLPSHRTALSTAAAQMGRTLQLIEPTPTTLLPASSVAPKSHVAPNVDTECALLYTSGTTGRPKGCVLPNEYFLYAGLWYNTIGGLCDVRPGCERMLSPLPLTHMNAMAVSFSCMVLSGGCLILLDRFHPTTWWTSVRASRATIVHYLGVMPAMLMGAPPSEHDRDHAVRFGFGAGVNPRHHAAFESRFGFPLLEAWAMTETGSGAVVIANHEPRQVGTACFGRAEPAVLCRVVDDEGQEVPPDHPGELLVRHAGPEPRFGFFREYLKDPEATAEAWAGDWFHTGDLVRRDAEGYFRFVDRKKNIIRRSGENIAAVEVESVLIQHPGVRAVGVSAVPDEVRGDEVLAVVVPRAEVTDPKAFADSLVEFALERLAYYKAPGFVALCAALPLTPTEKIQRGALKSLGVELVSTGQSVDVRNLKKRRDL
jgi:acyl-coenzyme A synthetase/AMP-(fatty) acid ligase